MKSKHRRGIDMVDKPNRYISFGLLLLVMAALVLVPAASALPEYYSALKNVYGDTGYSCGTCHIDPNGGGARNAYGILLGKQIALGKTPTDALKAIGAPPKPQNTTVVSTSNVTSTQNVTSAKNVTSAQNVTSTQTPVATVTQEPTTTVTQAPITTDTQDPVTTDTPIPVPTKKSPGVGMVAAIGIIGTIYIIRRRK